MGCDPYPEGQEAPNIDWAVHGLCQPQSDRQRTPTGWADLRGGRARDFRGDVCHDGSFPMDGTGCCRAEHATVVSPDVCPGSEDGVWDATVCSSSESTAGVSTSTVSLRSGILSTLSIGTGFLQNQVLQMRSDGTHAGSLPKAGCNTTIQTARVEYASRSSTTKK